MRSLLAALSRGNDAARLSILIFHRVLREADPLLPDEMDAARFDQVCGWLRKWFNVVTLGEGCRRLRDGSLPLRSLAITFDDGYADNHDVAVPILRKHGLTATFFVATGFLDGGRMWNDTLIEAVRRTTRASLDVDDGVVTGLGRLAVRTLAERRAALDRLIAQCRYLSAPHRLEATHSIAKAAGAELPSDLMMSSAQVRGLLRAGMSVGGHTMSHPILSRLPAEEARREIEGGKVQLEVITQAPVSVFAYPNGRPDEDYRAEHVAMVRALGFEAAVTTAWGTARCLGDPYQMPRFTPWDRSRWAFGLRMAANLRRVPMLLASPA